MEEERGEGVRIAERRIAGDRVVRAEGEGEQTVKDGTKGAMYQSSSKAVVIVTAQTGSYSQIASVLKNPVKFAGGTCGTMEASGQAASACVGELSDGLMMVINSQQSDLAEQAKFAAALYAAS